MAVARPLVVPLFARPCPITLGRQLVFVLQYSSQRLCSALLSAAGYFQLKQLPCIEVRNQ